MELSVVIPCYNEEDCLPETYRRIKTVCDGLSVDGYEIIFIDDGSTDSTPAIINDLSQQDSHVTGLSFSRNFGHEQATSAGLSHSTGNYVLLIDADLQDPPELLPDMLSRAREGVDVVYGQRLSRSGESRFKLAASDFFYEVLSWLSDIHIPKNVGDFRLVSRRVVEQFLIMPEQNRFIRGMISWIGFRQEPIAYSRAERFAGKSKYDLRKLFHLALDAISGFSIKPIRISLLFAFIGLCFSGLFGIYVLLGFFVFGSVSGWASLSCIVILFNSLQLVCIGLIGEYVGRTYMEVKKRPLYIVRQIYKKS